MSWDAAFPVEAQRSALDLASRPLPAPEKPTNFWQQAGTFLAAPFTGAATGINESLRAAYTAATAGADDVMLRQQREVDDFTAEAIFRRRLELDDERADMQARLRSGAQYWRPSPEASNLATQFVFEASRTLTKVGGYAALTRNPLATAALVGADEGVTGYSELRDQGVDPATAAKVGATRGAAMALGVALPAAAGGSIGKTAALALAGGPGIEIAEKATAREILRAADYPDLAEQYDPFDPVALAVSTVVSGAVGAVAVRNARRAAAPTPEQVDAAHVVARRAAVDEATLGDPRSIADADAHARAVADAQASLDAGRPISADRLAPIDVERAELQTGPLRELVDAVETETARTVEPARLEAADGPALRSPVENAVDTADQLLVERAQRLIDERPELELRLGDAEDAPVVRAADLMRQADDEIRAAETEGRAYQAAVACALTRGE